MSIRDFGWKINNLKRFGRTKVFDDFLIILIIILSSTASFGLGILSERGKGGENPIRVINQEGAAFLSKEELQSGEFVLVPERDPGGHLVASKNGSKYHFPWCSGAQRIKEENKIWFKNIEEARKSGYTPALNCKGLE